MSRVAIAVCVVAVWGGGCQGDRGSQPDAGAISPRPPDVVVETPPLFPADTLSLKLLRTVAVRLGPGEEAKQIGTIAQDIRIAWTATAQAKGCKKVWIEMRPRGWVCADYVEPSPRPPVGVELPRLSRGEVVPGTYGKVVEQGATTYQLISPPPEAAAAASKKPDPSANQVTAQNGNGNGDGSMPSPDEVVVPVAPAGSEMRAGRPLLGSVNVRKYGEILVGGRRFWKISARENEYVLAGSVYEHKPSPYYGVRLGDETGRGLPFAFVWPRWGGTKAWTYGTSKGTSVVRQVDQRTGVWIQETANTPEGKPAFYRIGPWEWISVADVRLVEAVPPPPLIEKHERWFDVDLDAQVLIAYEGDYPVYATMVSTGTKETPTETGIFRMWKKVAETDMRGLSGEDPYSVATVPWTQFFSPEKGLALHAAYWHDRFGVPRSHGCVNLAPFDARWLYFWSDPQVPPGWTMAAGVSEAPGSIVRVRSKADPNPELKGYARKVYEQRAQSRP